LRQEIFESYASYSILERKPNNRATGPVCLFSIARKGGFMVLLAYQPTSTLAHYRGFIKTGAAGASTTF
jgi:hypothetical protein